MMLRAPGLSKAGSLSALRLPRARDAPAVSSARERLCLDVLGEPRTSHAAREAPRRKSAPEPLAPMRLPAAAAVLAPVLRAPNLPMRSFAPHTLSPTAISAPGALFACAALPASVASPSSVASPPTTHVVVGARPLSARPGQRGRRPRASRPQSAARRPRSAPRGGRRREPVALIFVDDAPAPEKAPRRLSPLVPLDTNFARTARPAPEKLAPRRLRVAA